MGSDGPLHGLTIFDVGRFVAGPVSATILGEFGARVIKFEKPGRGDELRHLGPALHSDASAWWALEGRNKELVGLDLGHEAGQAAFKGMVAHADVLVENFRPGTLERWGLDFETLSGINPRLILLRTSGYGQFGPYRLLPGLNTAGEALGGLRYIVGFPDRPPSRPGVAIADYTAALMGAIGVLIALYERDAREGSGRGQWIDNTLYEAVMRIMEWTFVAYDQRGIVRERVGAESAGTVPARAYLSKDEHWVGIAAAGDKLFGQLATAIGEPSLATDERFLTNAARISHRGELDEILERWAAEHEADKIVSTLQAGGVPANLVYSVAEIFQDPHVAERASLVPVPGEDGQSIIMQAVVPRLSRTPGRDQWAGRRQGSDTASVFSDWLDAETIESLHQAGVISW